MKITVRLWLALTTAFLLSCGTHWGRAQNVGPLLFEDDFSTSNSVWRFNLVETRGNQSAIDASYGKIESGVLTLKANVGCGWDFLGSIASLQFPLPTNYVIEYRARKMQWCGSFRTDISPTPTVVDESHFNPPSLEFGMAGNWFSQLCNWNSWEDQGCVGPTTGTQINGQWYDYRIVKRGTNFNVFMNGILQWSYAGQIFPGGFLHFGTGQAGSTAEIDDLKISAIAPSLEIEVAAVRVRWLAESNVAYRVEWSTNHQNWTPLAIVIGNGGITNILDWTGGERRFYRYVQVGEIDLADGLVAYYPLNGNANDYTRGNDGTVNGAVLDCDRFGNDAAAYRFDGTNSFIELPESTAFDSQDFSVSMWFKPARFPDVSSNLTEADFLISKGQNNFELHTGSSVAGGSGMRFLPRVAFANHWDTPSATYQTNLWQHVVAVYQPSGNKVRMFLNGGELALTGPIGTPSLPDNGSPARLGMRADGTLPFKGSLDDVRIYNRALNADEVGALYRLVD